MNQKFEDIEIPEDDQLADPGEYLADIPMRLTSGVLGLMGFMTACVVGLMAGNRGGVVLLRAVLAMVICAAVGRVLGIVGEVAVREYVQRYKSQRPRPVKPQQLIELDRAKRAHEHAVRSMKKAA